MKLRFPHILLSALLLLFATSCKDKQHRFPFSGNAVYYWRTTWQPTDKERNFMTEHHVERLYLRLFDVVGEYGPDLSEGQQGRLLPMPRATLHFNQPFDFGCEVIPVVFVTDDCLLADSLLAKKIVRRVGQFCETNDLAWSELQFDCDWRPSTREAYFRFLEQARTELDLLGKQRLSVTIRLHQFSQPAPPADYGVLMCYNTGSLKDSSVQNAILEEKEVRKYVKRLRDYSLPLCAAYPIYTWKRLFRNGRFVALINDVDVFDNELFHDCGQDVFRVKKSFSVRTPDPNLFGFQLVPGDTVKLDRVPAETIGSVKHLLEKQQSEIHNQVIIYSLNEIDFSKYTSDEIANIYTPCR